MSIPFKVIKHTTIPCDICKTWCLTKVASYNDDRFLICFHCDPGIDTRVKWTVTYDKTGKIATVVPYDKVVARFKTQDEAITRIIQVMDELD